VRLGEPPASWADLGQRVRTPGEVLDGREGTCLDTTLTLAAACELAGIRPLVWLVEGTPGRDADAHAFLGYWREARSADCAASTDVAELVSSVDLGRIRLVETTLLTDRGRPGADLHRPPYAAWLAGDRGRILGVTDVHVARTAGIRPLPAPAGIVSPAGTVFPAVRPDARSRVGLWADDLLDLSGSNPLLDSAGDAVLPLTLPPAALADLGRLVRSGTPVTLVPGDRMAVAARERGVRTARDLPAEQLTELLVQRRLVHVDVPEAGYPSRLRALAHRAATRAGGSGADDLHLALGNLVWEVDGRPRRSPLVLVPVVLGPDAHTGGYRLGIDESGSSTLNGCLLEELRRRHGLTVPGMAAPGEDGAGIDLDATLTALRTALAEHGLPYAVEATADLALLPVARFRQWADLDAHGAAFAANPLVAHLLHTPPRRSPTR
jgi:hypothetical protein